MTRSVDRQPDESQESYAARLAEANKKLKRNNAGMDWVNYAVLNTDFGAVQSNKGQRN